MTESLHPTERLQTLYPDAVHNIRPLMSLSQTLEDMSSEELEEFVYISGARGASKDQIARRLDISTPMLDVFLSRNASIRRAYNNGVAYYIDNMERLLADACENNPEFALKVLQSKHPEEYNRKAIDVNLNTPPIREAIPIEDEQLSRVQAMMAEQFANLPSDDEHADS